MGFKEIFADFWNTVINIIREITVVDAVDILLVSIVLYLLYKFIRDKRAGRLAAGVILFIIFLVISEVAGMRTMQYIFKNIFQVGVISLVILFQPEFRSLLEKVGASPIKGIKSIGDTRYGDSMMLAIREVASAAADMAAARCGALIVFERNIKLGDIISTGTVIDAQTGSFLLRNIFFNKSPLHDGAVIIRGSRIYSAGCLLPLSNKDDINRSLGTRHRAAIGLSETSDAVVVVVSEETGIISVAENGSLLRGFTVDSLRDKLYKLLLSDSQRNSRFSRRHSKAAVVNDGKESRNAGES